MANAKPPIPDADAPERAEVDPVDREVIESDLEYTRARRALEQAKTRRERAYRAARGRFPYEAWVERAGKRIRRRRVRGGRTFSLSDYLAAGHELTPEMEDHVKDGKPRDAWDIEDA